MFQARSALGVCPSELCSPRAAASCLQNAYPLNVQITFLPPESTAPDCNGQRPPQAQHNAAHPIATKVPSFPGSCSARESISKTRRFRPSHGFVALLGFCPSRALPLARTVRISPHLPSRDWLSEGSEETAQTSPQGVRYGRDRLVSRETAGPPGVCHLVTVTTVQLGCSSGVASSEAEVRRRPLSLHL
jgi:hypothetical protein